MEKYLWGRRAYEGNPKKDMDRIWKENEWER